MNRWMRANFQPNLPLYGERRVTASREHIELSREAAREGMVLLKNENGLLPLAKGSRIALFGKGSFDYVKGGGGSGDVTVSYVRNLYDGLKLHEDDVELYEPLSDFYRRQVQVQYQEGAVPGMLVEPELPESLAQEAAEAADVAVIVISRFSGEGWDRSDVEYIDEDDPWTPTVTMPQISGRVFPDGDFYLTATEQALVAQVKRYFSRIVVVLNVGGVVDTEWFRADDAISSVLLAWQGGMEGGLAAADLLCGFAAELPRTQATDVTDGVGAVTGACEKQFLGDEKSVQQRPSTEDKYRHRISPSGKLPDTFAKRLEDYPSTAGFHASPLHVDYTEDVYVGYRYFMTIPGARERVNYPFGYGLSYTTFSLEEEKIYIAHGEDASQENTINSEALADELKKCAKEQEQLQICLRIRVENTGAYPGKEVVQLYYQLPQGRLGQPSLQLGAFAKTKELQPGESECVTFSLPWERMASYDDLGKVAESAYVLERGKYCFYYGNSLDHLQQFRLEYDLPEDVIVQQLSRKCAPVSLAKRLRADGTYEELPTGEPRDPEACAFAKMRPGTDEAIAPAIRGRERYRCWEWVKPGVRPFGEVNVLSPKENMLSLNPGDKYFEDESTVSTDKEYCEKVFDKATVINEVDASSENRPLDGEVFTLDDFVGQLSDDDLIHLLGGQPNRGVANTFGIGDLGEYGVPSVMTADGPAGVRINPECGVCTTAFPCATLLASTWNVDLVEAVGRAGGEELKENNLSVWLAPAVNIHRNPMCGRNFEYYSEDPLLAGRLAGAMVRGIQSNGVSACVKHFACNNKETNRKASDSRVSERALREIYLKVFEIIVREADPWAMMSSYNIINGIRASENRELLTDILRGEWGFQGVVMTDWWSRGEQYKEILAGNDLKMATGYPERVRQAMDLGLLTREDLERSVKRVLGLILRIE